MNPRVRIELDADNRPGDGQPDHTSRTRRRTPAAVGALGLAAAALTLFAAFGWRGGEVGDGSLPPVPSTVPATTTTTTTAMPTDAGNPALMQRTNLTGNIAAAAVGEKGWVAVHWTSSHTEPPRIRRSSDGMDWTEPDVAFDLPSFDGTQRSFGHVTATDTGFAMIMVQTWEKADGTQRTEVDRLVSETGEHWSIDSDAPSLDFEDGRIGAVEHLGQWMKASSGTERTGHALAAQVLETELIESLAIEDLCWIGAAEGVVQLASCGGTGQEIGPESFRDPNRSELVSACLLELQRRQFAGGRSVTTVGSGHVGRTITEIEWFLGGALLEDGTIVVFDAGAAGPTDACDDVVELEGSEPASPPNLIVWPAGFDAPLRVLIPTSEALSEAQLRSAVGRNDGAIRVILGDTVWEIERGFEALRSLDEGAGINRRFDAMTGESVQLTPDGSRVVRISTLGLEVTDLDTGERSDLGRVDDRGGWAPRPLVLTDDVIVLATAESAVAVSLHP